MARELLAIDEDLPFRFKDPYHTRVDNFELHTFKQCWADTTCGFGGMGHNFGAITFDSGEAAKLAIETLRINSFGTLPNIRIVCEVIK